MDNSSVSPKSATPLFSQVSNSDQRDREIHKKPSETKTPSKAISILKKNTANSNSKKIRVSTAPSSPERKLPTQSLVGKSKSLDALNYPAPKLGIYPDSPDPTQPNTDYEFLEFPMNVGLTVSSIGPASRSPSPIHIEMNGLNKSKPSTLKEEAFIDHIDQLKTHIILTENQFIQKRKLDLYPLIPTDPPRKAPELNAILDRLINVYFQFRRLEIIILDYARLPSQDNLTYYGVNVLESLRKTIAESEYLCANRKKIVVQMHNLKEISEDILLFDQVVKYFERSFFGLSRAVEDMIKTAEEPAAVANTTVTRKFVSKERKTPSPITHSPSPLLKPNSKSQSLNQISKHHSQFSSKPPIEEL